jgi:Fe2+ or Zn2+ uptake regulation protein
MEKSKSFIQSENLLREKAFKVTPSRVALLSLLIDQQGPLTVEDIEKQLSKKINKTTIYRALDDFLKKGILSQTHFRDGKIYYEYQDHHHHHIVCTSCGVKEKVSLCIQSSLPTINNQSKKFNNIHDHILEFFGVCNTCAST